MNALNPQNVLVELFAEGMNGSASENIRMKNDWMGEEGEHNFYAEVNTSRPTDHYTVRIVPSYEGVSVPLENSLILWQH